MLNPAYISEALGKERPSQLGKDTDGESQQPKKFGGEDRINPKLKQRYNLFRISQSSIIRNMLTLKLFSVMK